MFAFPELISLTPRCGTFSFLCPSLLLFVIQAMISNVHHLVPLVQEMARRKVFGYRHMLRLHVYILNSDTLALIFFFF